jgi:hypothetical protein
VPGVPPPVGYVGDGGYAGDVGNVFSNSGEEDDGIYVGVCIRTYIHMYMYMYIYVYVYTHTHTHTHTQ